MSRILYIVILALSAFLATLVFPWWSLGVIAAFWAIVFRWSARDAFITGFLSIFALWLIIGFWKDFANAHILSTRIAGLFHLPTGWLFILSGALIGGFIAGLASWSGAVLLNALQVFFKRIFPL